MFAYYYHSKRPKGFTRFEFKWIHQKFHQQRMQGNKKVSTIRTSANTRPDMPTVCERRIRKTEAHPRKSWSASSVKAMSDLD